MKKPTAPKPLNPKSRKPEAPPEGVPSEGHEGGTDNDIGDTGGPGAGYDKEPEQQKDEGGVV
jgi:hypothetical protein